MADQKLSLGDKANEALARSERILEQTSQLEAILFGGGSDSVPSAPHPLSVEGQVAETSGNLASVELAIGRIISRSIMTLSETKAEMPRVR